MGRFSKIVFIILFLSLVGIQFVEVEKTNPLAAGEIQAPPEVMKILRASCYDCHSNATKWPWYSEVAPISWFIADDVNSGRRHLNFSEWEKYNDTRKEKKLESILEEINTGEMPLKAYTYLHPGSELDLTQKETVKAWITGKSFGGN
jgi:hypothetical protein